MSDLFSYGPKSFREFVKTNLLAILFTIIIHLAVAIILVMVKVEGLKQDKELGVMLDFSKNLSLEEQLRKENLEVSPEWMEKVLEARKEASNKAVNLNDQVNKEISTKDYVQDLLDELESQKDEAFIKNREKLKEIISSSVYENDSPPPRDTAEKNKSYTGPTTITYEFLEEPTGRSKRFLAIPVYKCEGSATVVVDLEVRQDGSVSNVKVLSIDTDKEPACFNDAAQSAAQASSFRSDYSAPEKQRARITYDFIAQ